MLLGVASTCSFCSFCSTCSLMFSPRVLGLGPCAVCEVGSLSSKLQGLNAPASGNILGFFIFLHFFFRWSLGKVLRGSIIFSIKTTEQIFSGQIFSASLCH
jgi:hypothetical protein